MNGFKGEKGEPGDASVGFGVQVRVLWGRGWGRAGVLGTQMVDGSGLGSTGSSRGGCV